MNKSTNSVRAFKLYNSYNRSYFPLYISKSLFGEVIPAYFNLWISAEIINQLLRHETVRGPMMSILIALMGDFIFGCLSSVLSRELDTAKEKLKNQEKQYLMRKLLSLDYAQMEDVSIQDLRTKIETDSWVNMHGTERMRLIAESKITCIINIIVSVALLAEVVPLIMAARLNQISLTVLALLFLVTVAIIFWSEQSVKLRKPAADACSQSMLDYNKTALQESQNGAENRLFALTSYFCERRRAAAKNVRKTLFDYMRIQTITDIPKTCMTQLTTALSYLFVCIYAAAGAFPIGGIVKYAGYIERLVNNARKLIELIPEEKENQPYLDNYMRYLDLPEALSKGSIASIAAGDIDIRDVSFSYPGADTLALNKINLRIEMGKKIAVVGENGSGKSTLIKLISRMYEPNSGKITLGETNVLDIKQDQYMHLFSIVFQNSKPLSFSIADNVTCNSVNSEEAMHSALESVGLDDWAQTLAKGADTCLYKDVDDDGVVPSGGEAAKILIARALYRNSPFLIFDEPTASLDAVAESEIYNIIKGLPDSKTVIVISHRLSSCRFMDEIVVLDQGQIVQIGTHEQLIRQKSGKYAQLWEAQAKFYKSDETSV